jgi:phage terminase large subunit GpA-like protein
MANAYPASADEEGDPVTLAEARSLTFAHRRKVLLVSTPTIRGLSRIEREYEASDQRRFFVPCPHCDAMQWLKFERLRWEKGRPETVEYLCEGCERPIAEHHKTRMLERGEWRTTATAADPTTVGYHLSALYSPIGWLIPACTNQNPCAHSRRPMVMILDGRSMRRFHASQARVTMSS